MWAGSSRVHGAWKTMNVSNNHEPPGTANMSYRIYLQTADGGTFEKTETGSRSIAEAVFKSFLERDELEGKPVSVHLVHQRSTLAVHRFDAAGGSAENWQGRED